MKYYYYITQISFISVWFTRNIISPCQCMKVKFVFQTGRLSPFPPQNWPAMINSCLRITVWFKSLYLIIYLLLFARKWWLWACSKLKWTTQLISKCFCVAMRIARVQIAYWYFLEPLSLLCHCVSWSLQYLYHKNKIDG